MKVERFLHWGLLLLWFLLRYVLDCILELTDPVVAHLYNSKWRMRVPRAWDIDWLHFSSQLIALIVAWQKGLKIAAQLLRALPWLLAPLVLMAEHLWISSTISRSRHTTGMFWQFCQHSMMYCLISAKSLASLISPSLEDWLWRFLWNVIAFTAGRNNATITIPETPVNSAIRWMPSLIKTAFLFLIMLATVANFRERRSWHRYPKNVLYSGFTTKIPSCYDGDTCRLQDLAVDGQLLPLLFQQMNVRIKGIDAPERRRRARCPLERCLAELALDLVEDILKVGNDESRQLLDCQHDKYGKRLLCDILASSSISPLLLGFDGTNVASQLLGTLPALAAPYFGKTKTPLWCSKSFQQKHQDDPYLQECLDSTF